MVSEREVNTLLARAMNAHQTGQLRDAQQSYRAVLKKVPNHPVALHLLGITQVQEGQAEKGIKLVREAIRLKPDYIEARYNLACALQTVGRIQEAAEHYTKVVAIDPNHVRAQNNLGAILLQEKRFDEAINYFQKALAIDSNNPQANSNIGLALSELHHYEHAIDYFRKSLAISPSNVEVLCNLANALKKSNRPGEALAVYDKAASLQPNNADVSCAQGKLLLSIGSYQDALAAFDKALAIKADLAEAWLGKGDVYEILERYEDSVEAYDRALACKSDLKYTMGHRFFVKMRNCDWNEMQKETSHLLAELRGGNPVAIPFVISNLTTSTAEQQLFTQQFVKREYPESKRPLWQGERYFHDRIRVAYISADFRNHAVSMLMAGVFEHHDRKRFKTVAISFGPDDRSAMRSRIAKAFGSEFIDASNRSDWEIASLIRDMQIDIAVDLNGMTAGERFRIFAMRPAPVQVNYLGYPGTLGADFIDYIIADEIVIPRDQRQFYSEKVVYLPHCYQANDAARPNFDGIPSRRAVGLPETGFVFCSFNNSYKVTPDMFDIWMCLLRQVDGSVLWLLERNPSVSKNLIREAEKRGVAPERLIFAPRVRLEDHLARQCLADLFLDTLPYNAHTTASEALWVGLPVLTCIGSTFAGRVAASLLTAIGLPEQITYSKQEFEDRALMLAHSPALLASLKSKLIRNRATFPLFDTARSTHDLEAAYIAMWQRTQEGLPPTAFPGGDA